jgi:hypothetical protein
MHKAPSVTYPVGPCVWYGRVLWFGLLVVAGGALWSVLAGQMPSPWRVAAGLGLGLLVVIAVLAHLRRIETGQLTWRFDGENPASGEWLWQPASGRAVLVRVNVLWAGSNIMGMRLIDGFGQTLWVWAQAHQAPTDWLAFRRALISSTAAV